MIRKFTWLLLPSLLLPPAGARTIGASEPETPAISRLDDIRASLIAHHSPAADNREGTRSQKLTQWLNWPNWGNFWRNRF
jgi:hypothetical protein